MKAFLQSSPSECGLASLAMVAAHHGSAVTLPMLRQCHSMPTNHASLGRLMSVSAELGLQCLPLRLDLHELPQLRTPCLRWDLNHFVVLTRAGSRRATILDPAFGKRTLDYRQMSAHFSGCSPRNWTRDR